MDVQATYGGNYAIVQAAEESQEAYTGINGLLQVTITNELDKDLGLELSLGRSTRHDDLMWTIGAAKLAQDHPTWCGMIHHEFNTITRNNMTNIESSWRWKTKQKTLTKHLTTKKCSL